MNARAHAIANENQQIEESQGRAIAAAAEEKARPRNALEAMASRLEITPAGLKKTLLNTVFAECKNDEQFMALIVVSNAYGLNPLLKEIYAFPSKGGGIVPMVSIDGWIRLMNEHPAFNGIEFEYTLDAKGNTVAIEAIVYRRDRDHAVKVMEFMEECKGNTQPWSKSPRRMLRHRALIQGVRIAFGFSGIVAEVDEEVIAAQYREVEPMPTRKQIGQTLAEELGDEIPTFDKETGEVAPQGMTEVSEETARELDANDGTVGDDNPTAAEGPADGQRGEDHNDDAPPYAAKVQWIRDTLAKAKNKQQVKEVDDEYLRNRAALPDDLVAELDKLITDKRAELTRSAQSGEG